MHTSRTENYRNKYDGDENRYRYSHFQQLTIMT